MRLEFINRVTESDVLGKSILTNDGKVLLRSGVRLTSQYIHKLKELGVFYVYIEDDRLSEVYVEDERLNEIKKNTIKNMSVILRNINAASKNEIRDSLSRVEELIDYIIDVGDVNKSLYDIKTYDNYTYLHCIDTGIMAAFLGISMGLCESQLKELGTGAILHDIGKTCIDSKIINKTTALTEEEYREIRRHPVYGAEMLKKKVFIPDSVVQSVAQHHERVDGRGYPKGLSGNQICKFAKIVTVCDVYDAVINDRSYRKKFSPNEAYELILAGSGRAFDAEVVKKFRETFAVYPLGCCVKLSNGTEGYVIRQNSNFPDRPIIRILYDSETRQPIAFYEIDLLEAPSLAIAAVV
jgi:putative nucleotidyltransferase with HDIG domain